jgi:hypothetical protein
MRVAVLASTMMILCGCQANVDASAPQPTKIVPAGPTPKVDGNHESVELGEGIMNGNHNTVSGVTIEGGGTIGGNHNDATRAQLHGDVTAGGNKNQ